MLLKMLCTLLLCAVVGAVCLHCCFLLFYEHNTIFFFVKSKQDKARAVSWEAERRSAAGEKREMFHAELEHFLQRTIMVDYGNYRLTIDFEDFGYNYTSP
jgi:hypothetical protein